LKQPARTASSKLGQEEFLSLMIAQMKNQDPMKPMQNGEFLSQMAQFGTVNGITELQKSFGQLASSLQSNQALMASSMVGRYVLVPGSQAPYAPGYNVAGTIELPQAASDVAVSVYDANGQLMQRTTLGPQEAGNVRFVWDGTLSNGGTAPAGLYTIKAEAAIGNTTVALNTLIAARVDSVSLGGAQGLMLNLAGLGPVAFSDVKEIA
ncbi:MAG: flagellar hook assembly protein FlgD, partial [Gammaproteobacteria bacterium]|nr:flagellar hook assembly protein FlgD [Gammaproteobacteria bacterium]